MKLDFKKLKRKKLLGVGVYSSAYLCDYKGKDVVVRIQNILKKEQRKSMNVPLWRELEFFDFVHNLSNSEQLFFMKLLGYRVYGGCDRKVKHFPWTDKKQVAKLEKDKTCAEIVVNYKGETLEEFMLSHTFTKKQIYSIIIQFLILRQLLYFLLVHFFGCLLLILLNF